MGTYCRCHTDKFVAKLIDMQLASIVLKLTEVFKNLPDSEDQMVSVAIPYSIEDLALSTGNRTIKYNELLNKKLCKINSTKTSLGYIELYNTTEFTNEYDVGRIYHLKVYSKITEKYIHLILDEMLADCQHACKQKSNRDDIVRSSRYVAFQSESDHSLVTKFCLSWTNKNPKIMISLLKPLGLISNHYETTINMIYGENFLVGGK